jgi:hypothetical protein
MAARQKNVVVIESYNSDKAYPDFLNIDTKTGNIAWHAVDRKAGPFATVLQLALAKATHFKTVKEAEAAVRAVFGNKYKFRTSHQTIIFED